MSGVLTVAALLYTVGYAARYAYNRSADDLTYLFGMPDWVFWGVVVPWGVCLVLSLWFSWFMEDDELERAEPTPVDGPDLVDAVLHGHSDHDDRRESP